VDGERESLKSTSLKSTSPKSGLQTLASSMLQLSGRAVSSAKQAAKATKEAAEEAKAAKEAAKAAKEAEDQVCLKRVFGLRVRVLYTQFYFFVRIREDG
jgi:hypothetical protein